MLSASRVLAKANAGEPLPPVFGLLEHRGIKPRRGQITMVAGHTNAGKSLFALYYCLALARKGERVLYFSADSDENTQGTRMAAMVTGVATEAIEDAIRTDGGMSYYEDVLSDLDIRMDFESNPTCEYIELSLDAFDELYGQPPSVVVIDNLVNLEGFTGEGASEKSGLMGIQKFIKHVCRSTHAGVLLLHHCSESEGRPGNPPARKAVMQKVSELPENILTVAYNDETNRFGVAAVKLRNGRADPGAKNPVWLSVDMDRGQFGDSAYDLIGGMK